MKIRLKTKMLSHTRSSSLFLWLLFAVGCQRSDSDPSTPQDLIKEKLTTASWHLLSATVDGVDRASIYKDLVITFSASAYTSSGGTGVWPSAGSWSFEASNGATIQRDDGLLIDIAVDDDKLQMSFMWTKQTFSPGRVHSISGQHIMIFRH